MRHALRHLPLLAFVCASTVLCVPIVSAAESIESTPIPLKTQTTKVRFILEDLQWSATSVTVIDQAEIESTYRRTLEDLEGYVPGLVIDSISGSPQGAAISLRGIHSNNSSKGFEPAVAVSIDGVYVGTHAGQNQTLFDYERIEIARGPQGTFTAAPAEGGSINMVRTKPTGELGLKTRISAGEFKGRDLDAVLNFPIVESLAGKFTINHQKRDGKDLKNTFSDRRENGIDRTAYGLSLLWQARDNVTVQYTFDLERDDSDTPGLQNFSQPTDLLCVPDPVNAQTTTANCTSIRDRRLPESNNNQRFLQNFSNERSFETDNHIIRIDAEYFDHQITSITGFRSTKESFSQDLDATFVDKFSSEFDTDYDQFSTELRIAGQYSDSLSYIVGGYYFLADYDQTRNDLFLLDSLNFAGRIIPALAPGQSRGTQSHQESTTLSAFVAVTYRLDEQWGLDAGIRLARYEKDFDHTINGIRRIPAFATLFPESVQVVSGDHEFSEFSGHLGFSYKVDESAMIYGRYSADHTPGGFNDSALSALSAGNYETSTTQGIELGMKSHWMEDRVRLNMAFYNNYQDDKVQGFSDRVGTGNIEFTYDNISQVEVRGFDLELEFSATEALYLRGTWGHIANNYVRFDVPDLTTPGQVLALDRTPERSPSNTLYLNGQYTVPYRKGAFKIFAGYKFFDKYKTNPEIDIATVRRHSTWDASIEYEWQDYRVRLFSQNINDKRFIVNVDRLVDAQYASLLSTFTGTQNIATVADLNRPRYTGLEFIWTPTL
jgi:iron complex outermembrane receptor protein